MGAVTGLGRRLALAGVTVGAVAAGAAVGLAAERYAVGRSWRGQPDPEAGEPFGALPGEERVVHADDGVPLHVEVAGTDGTGVTVVFAHGYALNLDAWHYQRKDLDDVGRLVFYDHRGHGRSGRGSADHATIDQLGADLHTVIEACAPEGPIVLVGHSMGGMTLMAYAEQHPEQFGPQGRVVGVALLATSPGKLAEVTLGVPAQLARIGRRVAPRTLGALSRRPTLVERTRQAGSDLEYVLTKRYSFASDVPPSLVHFTAAMIGSTPVEVLAEFWPAFDAHDKEHVIDLFNGVEMLIVAGEGDLITPASHSEQMLARVPGAELVVLEDAGHMLLLEHHQVVSEHLRGLVERARRAAEAA